MAAKPIPLRRRGLQSAHRLPASPVALGPPPLSRRHFWRDAHGELHLATVYGLRDCPPLATGVALIVECDGRGRRAVCAAQHLDSPHATLNLAQIRHNGACLGGNEVHLLAGPVAPDAREQFARDLAGAYQAPYVA